MDLLAAFISYEGSGVVFDNIIATLQDVDPAVGVLALQGLYDIEDEVNSGQFQPHKSKIRILLRTWRNESPLKGAYNESFHRVKRFLKSLTIFQTFEVPLFVDDLGEKQLLSAFDALEDIASDASGDSEDTDSDASGDSDGNTFHINGDTPICHDTHKLEAKEIRNSKQLEASDNKNIIKGTWFGLDNSPTSVYGSRRFKTTLHKMSVHGLHQGEVVSYKKEVNVILYATDEEVGYGFQKPTAGAARELLGKPDAYVKVSIFVPEKFHPKPEEFDQVFKGPTPVAHGGFCVRAKRSGSSCKELDPI